MKIVGFCSFVAFSTILNVKNGLNCGTPCILVKNNDSKPIMDTERFFSMILLVFVLALNSYDLNAQAPSLFDHMYGPSITKIHLETNIESFKANRRNGNYIPAQFSFTDEKGINHNLSVDIRVRGKYRRTKCDLPPIKLNFQVEELIAKGYSSFDKYKIVTHCLDSDEGDEMVLKEHLVYQLQEEISPNSFRTQLIEITYLDTGSGDQSTHYAIIIESDKEMAQRLQGTICQDCYGVNRKFDQENVLYASVFQYMIGNTDWSIAHQKNVKVLLANNSDKFQLVSYDFDFSGLVKAPYYIPQVELGIGYRERYYKGLSCTEEQMLNCLDYFKSKEEQILGKVDMHPFLSKRSKIDIKRYLKTFFTQIDRKSGHKQIKGLAYIN